MAKKKTAPRAATVTTAPRASSRGGPVVIVRDTVKKTGRAIGRRRASGAAGASLQKTMFNAAIGGAIVGFVEKNWGDQIPTFPLLGRKGAIAAAIYFFKPKNGMIRDAGIAAASMAGYEFAKDGKVSGDDEDDE